MNAAGRPAAPIPVRRGRRAGLRRLLWALLLGLAAVPVLGAVLVALALQGQPAVPEGRPVSSDDVARAVQLLRTHDPRHAVPGVVSTALVLPRDVEVMLDHGARRWVRMRSQVELARGEARLALSLPVPEGPWAAFGEWLNLQLVLGETGGLPLLEQVRVGRLPLPAWLAERLGRRAAERLGLTAELELAGQVLRRVRFRPEHVLVTYAWQPDSAVRLFAGLLPPEELERLRAYSDRLVALTRSHPPYTELPLATLLPGLAELARTRAAAGGDAAAELRAALATLTVYANRRHLGSVVPVARQWPRPTPAILVLGGRPDFPLHFLVSALLAAESTSPLSQAIGLYKELADAKNGSGFSFNDMAANLAGTRFGERLLREPAVLAARLAGGVADSDLIPPVDDLPEFMPEAQFRARFGGVGAPAYEAMVRDIESRVARLPILR